MSCAPVNNNSDKKILIKNHPTKPPIISEEDLSDQKLTQKNEIKQKLKTIVNPKLLNEMEIILPQLTNENIAKHLINSFELSIYKKEINNISLNINRYANLNELDNLLQLKAKPGKIFIGTLSIDATKLVKQYCDRGILFFSFASNKKLGENCTYLINFFPEDDLKALFNFFPSDSKIALLYPENYYGYNISKIIDPIASQSKSLIINRASYKEDLTNARESIKELSKYELRKYELERQKKFLKERTMKFL